MRRRLGQHGVQGDDERLRQLLVSDATYSPSRPPKIPYSCWSRTTSTSSRPEDPGRANVVAAHALRDRCHEPGPLRPRRLVDDHDLLDAVDPVEAEQRSPHVCGERADAAGPRRVCGDDRGAHGQPASLP